MKNKNVINTQIVFAEKGQVFINSDTNTEEWHPINFQWIPIINLHKKMNQ